MLGVIMSDFKLTCKVCGQPTLVRARDIGQTISCVSCQTPLTITAPESDEDNSSAEEKPMPPGPVTPAAEITPPPVQVAVLTPDIKLEVVRAARQLIIDESRWIPGLSDDGKYRYAANSDGKELTAAEIGDQKASRHSLMGAVLAELQNRNVSAIARGRVEFLDQEIPAAIRQVIGGDATQPAQSPAEGGGSDPQLLAIHHDQCLAALDRLAQNYQAETTARSDSKGTWEIRGATLDELMARVSKDELITNAELLRALYRELTALESRIRELEQQ
jgi:hypothetical protein